MTKPVRVFDGNAKPYEPFWRCVNAADTDGGEPEIEFYGVISEYGWWGDEITPKKFKDDLTQLGQNGPVTVRINSGGGEVIAASVIRSILMEYPGRITVRVDGLCASAATFVATAGDVIKMQDTALWMIHDPSIMAWGTVEDLRQAIDLLKAVKDGIVSAYETRTHLGEAKLAKLMSDETWMSADEAQGMGFVDEVIRSNTQKASAVMRPGGVAALKNYVNVPAYLAALANLTEPQKPVETITPEAARLRDEAKILRWRY